MKIWRIVLFVVSATVAACQADGETEEDDRVAECTSIYECVDMQCGDEWDAYTKASNEEGANLDAARNDYMACVSGCAGETWDPSPESDPDYIYCVDGEAIDEMGEEVMGDPYACDVITLASQTYTFCDYGWAECNDLQAACFG